MNHAAAGLKTLNESAFQGRGINRSPRFHKTYRPWLARRIENLFVVAIPVYVGVHEVANVSPFFFTSKMLARSLWPISIKVRLGVDVSR